MIASASGWAANVKFVCWLQVALHVVFAKASSQCFGEVAVEGSYSLLVEVTDFSPSWMI